MQHGLFPAHCQLCYSPASAERVFCQGCEDDLPRLRAACPVCGVPTPSEGICARCQARPPVFDSTLALYHYEPPVTWCIRQMKYHQKLALAGALGEQMARFIETRLDSSLQPDLILPVPLHRKRLHKRGYNQALELARPIARRLKLPVDWRSLRRSRPTAEQAGLDAKSRRKNVRGAFVVARPLHATHVALVDDVMTTGSTLNELSKILKKQGVERIDIWVCARALS